MIGFFRIALALVYLAVPAQVRDNREVAAATWDFTGESCKIN